MFDIGLAEALRLIVILLATGGIAGLIAGLLGVGGGIVVVPVLFFTFLGLGVDEAVRMHVAVGTSLGTILFTGAMSAHAHWRKGAVDLVLLRSWGPAIAVGVIAGTVIGGNVAGVVLTTLFALVAAFVAINMAFKPAEKVPARPLPGPPLREALGLLIGVVSVMVGIGGGSLSVPIMSYYSYPMRKAVGTASAIGLIIAVLGIIGYAWFGRDAQNLPPLSLGYVNLAGLACIVPASMLTAPLGARIAHAIPPIVLRWCFAAFLAATSIRMMMSVV